MGCFLAKRSVFFSRQVGTFNFALCRWVLPDILKFCETNAVGYATTGQTRLKLRRSMTKSSANLVTKVCTINLGPFLKEPWNP